MGIASLGGLLSGAGNVSAPTGVGNTYSNLLNTYLGSQGKIYNAAAQYQPQYAGLQAGTLASLAPGASATVNSINPGASNLMSELSQSASQQLAAGTALDPGLENVAQQSVRGAQAARGLGYGPGDAINEAIGMTGLGNQLQQQRQNFASNVAGQQFQTQTSPALGLLAGSAATNTPALTPPSLTSQLLTMPYMAKLQANQATAGNAVNQYNNMDSNQSSFVSGL